MSETSEFSTQKNQTPHRHRWFSVLYRTRVKVYKENTPILNLSVLFTALAAISAPWVAVVGFIAALALGYRFGVERNAAGFSSDLNEVVQTAAKNVKSAVESVVENGEDKAQR